MVGRGMDNTKTALAKIFSRRCDIAYAGLRSKHSAKFKHGVETRCAIPIPFSAAELREWIRNRWFLGDVEQPIPCFYCAAWIDCSTFSLDHAVPWRVSLDSSFSNLRLCCEDCNSAKSDLQGETFVLLLLVLNRYFRTLDVQKILSLVRMGGGYKRLAYIGHKQKPVPISAQMDIPNDF